MATNTNPTNVYGNEGLYWVLVCCGLVVVGVLLAVGALTYGLTFKIWHITFNVGLIAFEFAAFYAVLSFKYARADTNAGAYCYGKALKRFNSGPNFIPWGFIQFETRSRLVQEFQCPGEPEKIFNGHDSETLPEGMVRPIRVTSRDPGNDEKGILDAQMTFSVNFVVQYAISDVFDFIANFGDSAQVEKQVRDIGQIIISEVASTTTPGGFIRKLTETNQALHDTLANRLEHLGVKVVSVRLISPDLSHKVAEALAGIPVASAEAQQTVIRANADKTRREKEGSGNAFAEKAMLTARAVGRKKIADELKVDGTTVLAAETAATLANAGTVVVGADGGMKDLIGVVKAAQTVLQPKGGKP